MSYFGKDGFFKDGEDTITVSKISGDALNSSLFS